VGRGSWFVVHWRREFQISNLKFQIVLSLYYWADLRIWSKNRVFFGWYKFVSAYMERGKKNLKLAVFGIQVAAFLIEILLTKTLFLIISTF